MSCDPSDRSLLPFEEVRESLSLFTSPSSPSVIPVFQLSILVSGSDSDSLRPIVDIRRRGAYRRT